MLVYPISIVAKLTDIPIRMLREYEKKGLIKSRKINGRRLFSNCEVGFIKDLRFYLKERNMMILGLKEFYLRSRLLGDKKMRCRKLSVIWKDRQAVLDRG